MNATGYRAELTIAEQLRRKAELCRRAAAIPTRGGLSEDRALLDLAQRLEQEADATEREGPSGVSIFRLDPILTGQNDPKWESSHIKEVVWARATTPAKAREVVAIKTLTVIPRRSDDLTLLSPWCDDRLATCVLDTARTDILAGAVIRADGKPV
jgi:hypothetical protein